MQSTDLLEKSFRLTADHKKALKRLGLVTVEDLLRYFPIRYSDMSEIKYINELEHNETATVYGRIVGTPQTKKSFRTKVPMAEAKLEDLKGTHMKIVWFNQAFIAKSLNDGDLVKLTGKVSHGKYGYSLTNPEIEQIPDMPIDAQDGLFAGENNTQENIFGYPIYRETKGLTSKWIYHAIRKAFAAGVLDEMSDTISEDILSKYNLPSLKTALVWIHTPQKKSDADAARKRFAFEEIFFIQLQKLQERADFESNFSYQLQIDSKQVKKFIGKFPFTLTSAQDEAIQSVIDDMQGDKPMSRLIEGDVGSGKTAVAATVSAAVVNTKPHGQDFGNLQVAYMAPTEVLASQLFESFIEYFEGTGMQIGLITGSGCKKFPSKVTSEQWTTISRNQLLKWVENGEVPILVGTHTLIQKGVKFKNLGLVIIDEQHRFGTKQRMKLAKKDGHVPHYLSMTATPIPRTLALTIYGDLDLSVIDQLPAGRKQVITEIIKPDKRDEIYEKIRNELEDGRQAYVICPRIGAKEDEELLSSSDELSQSKLAALQLKSVRSEAKRLQNEVFQDYNVDIMHSKMNKAEKEKVMEQFYDHKIDILVSTSVVEVGVNVPNATVIIIEGAERFGLAQLHQLRGRVQRSSHQSYCYLFADAKSEKTIERMKAIITAKNGFELAELDLAQRGMGDLAGKKQWGISDLAMDAIKNIKMVEAARTEAQHIIKDDPKLENETHQNYKAHLATKENIHDE